MKLIIQMGQWPSTIRKQECIFVNKTKRNSYTVKFKSNNGKYRYYECFPEQILFRIEDSK